MIFREDDSTEVEDKYISRISEAKGLELLEFKEVFDREDRVFDNASSSSILNDSSNMSYDPQNVVDKDYSTKWAEGASGDGIGEWIQVSCTQGDASVSQIKIVNGLATDMDKFYKNNRVKKAKLTFSDGSETTINLDDTASEQVIDIGYKVTSYVRLTILDVYSGSKYNDTCISEIEYI